MDSVRGIKVRAEIRGWGAMTGGQKGFEAEVSGGRGGGGGVPRGRCGRRGTRKKRQERVRESLRKAGRIAMRGMMRDRYTRGKIHVCGGERRLSFQCAEDGRAHGGDWNIGTEAC